jgi:hypothetical protein
VLSEQTGTPIPAPIAELESKPLRFSQTCPKNEMGDIVLKMAGVK